MLGSVELIEAQLRGIGMWHQARGTLLAATTTRGPLGEQRLETMRRRDAIVGQLEAIRERSSISLALSRQWLSPGPTVILAHRYDWNRSSLRHEFEVQLPRCLIDETTDGATAVGMVVAEQPDLVVLQHQLPLMNATEAVPEIREFSPATKIAVHVPGERELTEVLEAGADFAYVDQRASGVVRQLVELLPRPAPPR